MMAGGDGLLDWALHCAFLVSILRVDACPWLEGCPLMAEIDGTLDRSCSVWLIP